MLLLRKIVFYIFALIYLVLCPLIVLRMLGFVINPMTHRLVKTGLVYITTNPPDAVVYIDGREVHQKTPTAVRDLTPGKHFIRVKLNGYKDWESDIPIVAKKATVMANTLLIPEEWPITAISAQRFQNILKADDDILIATNPLLKDITIFHTTQGIEEDLKGENTYRKVPLFAKNSIYAQGRLVNIYNAPRVPFILLQATIKDRPKFFWANLNENPPRVEDISDLFQEVPEKISWNVGDNEEVFAFYPDSMYRINIKNKAVFPQNHGQLPSHLIAGQPDALPDKILINAHNDTLIREGQRVRLYPKEGFAHPAVYDIAQTRPSTNMYFEEQNGELFYLDHKAGTLNAAQILPYHPILNIPIPDALKNKNKENGGRLDI